MKIVANRHGLVMAAAGADASKPLRERCCCFRPIRCLGAATARSTPASNLASQTESGRYHRHVWSTLAPRRDRRCDWCRRVRRPDDFRGRHDRYGNELSATITAIADEVARAAELAAGKTLGVPVTVLRGLSEFVTGTPEPGSAADLIRPLAEICSRWELPRHSLQGAATPHSIAAQSVHSRTSRSRRN